MSNFVPLILSAASLCRGWLIVTNDRMAGGARLLLAAALLSALGLFAGCTDVSIARARHQMAAGNYTAAHTYFATEAAKSGELSPRQKRLVMDGLCRSEYQVGAPTYPLIRQLQTCADAVNQPGSESTQLYSEVASKERDALTQTIDRALTQQDIARAEDAILRYRKLPGNDPQLAARWTREVWTIVNHEAASTPGKAALAPAIAHLSHQFRHLQGMSDQQFRRWVEENMTVSGNLMVANVEIGQRTVDLWLGDDQFANAALNLDRFARVNDGLVARCHCDGRTKVLLKNSGLPAYLVRLDTANHQSEVLILDQP